VEKFIAGDAELGVSRKFVAPRDLITRVIVGLMTNRGAMLIGPPGTAKSWLSELLAAAISGDSTLIVQGGAITRIQQLLYSWNEAVLQNQGPCPEALIGGPFYHAMAQGRIVRFEEIARAPTPLQDALISILSERQFSIPELGPGHTLFARAGFNVIASSNVQDEGLNPVSAALKRRLNFETIFPIDNPADEFEVVHNETRKLLRDSGIDIEIPETLLRCLVTIFFELREGQSIDGRSTDRLSGTSMSTAEAISVAHALCAHAHYYRNGEILPRDLVLFLVGAALKDNPEDRRRLKHYFSSELAQKSGAPWQEISGFSSLI
jgi:MoxR-like ATPase